MSTPIIPDGYKVIANDHIGTALVYVQTRFPRSKKIRIRKKWAKNLKRNYGAKKIHRAFFMHNQRTIFVSHKVYDQLKQLPCTRTTH